MRVSDHPAAQAGPEQRAPRPAKPATPGIVAVRMAFLEAEIDLLQGTLATIQSRIKAMQAALHSGDAQAVEANAALMARKTKATERYNALLALRNQCTAWLQVAGTLEDARPKIKVPTMPSALDDAITDLRVEINSTKESLAKVSSSPVKPVNLKGQVRAFVLALAAKGRPPTATIRPDGRIDVRFDEAGYAPNPASLVAWLNPDQMTERLVADITERQAQMSRPATMTAEEKAERIAELKKQLDKAERRDAYLTARAIDSGSSSFVFRTDTAVDAFLGVRALRPPLSNRAIQEASR
jgi:hypothetical protein